MAKQIIGKEYKKVIKARKKITKKGKARNVKLKCNFKLTQGKDEKKLIGNNVLGYIEGTDEK